jgi:hypothetical protein
MSDTADLERPYEAVFEEPRLAFRHLHNHDSICGIPDGYTDAATASNHHYSMVTR